MCSSGIALAGDGKPSASCEIHESEATVDKTMDKKTVHKKPSAKSSPWKLKHTSVYKATRRNYIASCKKRGRPIDKTEMRNVLSNACKRAKAEWDAAH